MLVSIITVSRNAVKTIEESAQSVALQTHQSIEHILIDGDSSDGTVEAARAANPRMARIISERDDGIYDAMNKGLKLATGEIVGFLNADDLYADPGVIARIVEVMSADPRLDLCYADLDYVNRENPDCIIRRWRSSAYRPGLFATGWVPAHPTAFFRTKTLHRIGGFDGKLRIAADFELLLRAFKKYGVSSQYVNEVWVKMRVGGASNRNIKGIVRGNLEIMNALRRYRVGWPVGVIVCRLIRRVPQFFQLR